MQKRNILAGLLLSALVLGSVGSIAAQSPNQSADTMPAMPKVGAMAPDFTLSYFDGNDLKQISLSQYRGKKNVVVAFFIFAFTGG
jgi:cytochrome oxidase Cu insertion factor (SCO1/SenC/PrrC family)